jgi:NADH-quinone oxidoreductase subunit C
MTTPTEPTPNVPAVEEPVVVDQPLQVNRGAFGSAGGSGNTSGYGTLVTTVMPQPAAQRPYGEWFDQAVDVLEAALPEAGVAFGEAVTKVVVEHGELVLYVEREHLVAFAKTMRDDPDLRFEMCMGVSGVHWPEDSGQELHAIYPFLSITHNRRIRAVVRCPDADPHIPSIISIYPGNNWHERETFDFFGIIFDGHEDLARITMPDDWIGHPQRKDYPLGGIDVEYKGAVIPPPDERRRTR